MADRPTTLAGVMEAATKYLVGRQIQDSARVVEWLSSAAMGIPFMELALRGKQELTESQLETMRGFIRRAATGEPVQYIVGEWDFMGNTFKVDRRALIPRPETEGLVEAVLSCQDVWMSEDGRPCILDIGTGSGCIAISLALSRPDAGYVAVDISDDALMLARENARRHEVRDLIVFTKQDLSDVLEPGSVAAVVANLPYIPTREYEQLEPIVREFEPRLALDGGRDGLDVIRVVAEESSILLRMGGRLFLEIAADQGTAVTELLESLGYSGVTVRKDLAGRDRVVAAILS